MDLETDKYVRMLASGASESKVRRELDADGFDPDFFFDTIKSSHRSGSRRAPPPAPKRSYTNSTRKRGRYDDDDDESLRTDSRSDSSWYNVESIPNSSFRRSLRAVPSKFKAFRVAVGQKLTAAYGFVRRKRNKQDRRLSVESTDSVMPPPSTPPPPRLPRRPTYMLSTNWMNKFIGRTSTEHDGRYNRKGSFQSEGEEMERYQRKPSILDRLTGLGRRKESVETEEEPLPIQPNTAKPRKGSLPGGVAYLKTRKSSLGNRFSVARIANRFKVRGAQKRLTGLDQSPGVAQRVQAFKAKIASDDTVNNHVPTKKVRRKMSTFMAPASAPPKELEEVAKTQAVKKNLQKFQAHNEKMRREDSRVRKAVKKTLERNVKKFNKPINTTTSKNGHNRTLYKGKKWSVPRSPGLGSNYSGTPTSNNSRTSIQGSEHKNNGRGNREGSLGDYVDYDEDERDDAYDFYSDDEDEEEEPLPKGWLRDYSEEWDEFFYVNLVTEESTWIKPTKPAR